ADVWLGNADAVTGKEEGVESKGPSHEFTDSPLLTIRNLQKRFIIREGLFSSPDALVAVDNIDLHIYQGEVLGIIGESGSGKSVTAEMIVKLQEPTAGEVWFQ